MREKRRGKRFAGMFRTRSWRSPCWSPHAPSSPGRRRAFALQRAQQCLSVLPQRTEAVVAELQLIEALRYLRKEQVIHRDLKLGNIFLSKSMQLRVGD